MIETILTAEALSIANTSPALTFQSDDSTHGYPAVWMGGVPLIVRMAKDVVPDDLLPIPIPKYDDVICKKNTEYYVWVNSYGAVSAIFPNGVKLGLKPYEFGVVKWHDSPREQANAMCTLTPGVWTVGSHPSEVVSNEKVTNTNFPCPPNPRQSWDCEKELYRGYLICESIGSPADAKVIAASKDLLEALTGHEDPHLWNIEWLSTLLKDVKKGMVYIKLVQASEDDYDSVNMMLSSLENFVNKAREAIKKATD